MDEFPDDLASIGVEIPGDVAIRSVEIADLPDDWRLYPASDSLHEIGAAWVRKNHSSILRVPSVVIPDERNYLMNPAHRDSAKIKIVEIEPFQFDPRIWRKPC